MRGLFKVQILAAVFTAALIYTTHKHHAVQETTKSESTDPRRLRRQSLEMKTEIKSYIDAMFGMGSSHTNIPTVDDTRDTGDTGNTKGVKKHTGNSQGKVGTSVIYDMSDLKDIKDIKDFNDLDPVKVTPWVGIDITKDEYLELHRDIIRNPVFHGRPVLAHPEKGDWKEKDALHFAEMITTGGMNISWQAQYFIGDRMEEWEWSFIQAPPLGDADTAGYADKSRVVLLNPKEEYSVGDVARIRIDIHDNKGKPLTRGGDDVRVNLREPKNNQSCLAPEVKDLGNGSYIADVPLLWAGKPTLKTKLIYKSESVRAFYRIHNAIKSGKILMGEFAKDNQTEATLCSHFPTVWFYEKICDLTKHNAGVEWYCGRPASADLTCDDWKSTRDLVFFRPLPMSDAEEKLNNKKFDVIPDDVILNVVGKEWPRPKHLSRREENVRSWTAPAPHGVFHGEVWYPTRYELKRLSHDELITCLKNTTIYLNGDSNLRIGFEVLAKRIGCAISTGQVYPKWHHPLECVDSTNSIEVHWQIHGMPFHGGADAWCERSDYVHVADTLDNIPSKGKFVVLINLNLHYTYHHYSMYTQHIRVVVAAMKRAVRRNPDVRLVVRAPHQAYNKFTPVDGGDLIGPLYANILRREFQGLRDKAFFISPWDMTIGADSASFHPTPFVNEAIADVLIDYVCNVV